MDTAQFLNHEISVLIGGTVKGNKFGIELELEGKNVALQDVATKGWRRTQDGSLRGESVEYVTSSPVELKAAKKLMVDLFKKFEENKVVFNDSIRTSTHVHLNFTDKTAKQVVNFFTLFTVFEELLQYYSGEDRRGNLFCISSRDAEGIVQVLSDAVARGSFDRFAGDRYKYAACNLSTLYKFGSIEIRTMRGATSADQVNKWLDILNDLYEYALNKMETPSNLIQDLSAYGAEEFMRRVFAPESVNELLRTFPVVQTLHYSLMEGARLLQVFAFEHEAAFLVKKEDIKEVGYEVLPATYQVDGVPVNYFVWTPEGRWACYAPRGKPVFTHGDACSDNAHIIWDGIRGRFITPLPGGEVIVHPWARHPLFGDEGRPVVTDEERRLWRDLIRGRGRFNPALDDEEDNDMVDVEFEDEEEDDF